MAGNDVLFGDGQDDDLIGGVGHDRIYGGTGEDGIARRRRHDPHQPQRPDRTALRRHDRQRRRPNISLPGPFTGAWIFITGRLHKTPSTSAAFDAGRQRRDLRRRWATTSCTAGPATTRMSGAEGAGRPSTRPRPSPTPTRSATTRSTRKLAAYDANNPLAEDRRLPAELRRHGRRRRQDQRRQGPPVRRRAATTGSSAARRTTASSAAWATTCSTPTTTTTPPAA